MNDNIKFAMFVLMFILVIASAIWFLIWVSAGNATINKKNYEECKQKTNDIEWCIQKTFGIEL